MKIKHIILGIVVIGVATYFFLHFPAKNLNQPNGKARQGQTAHVIDSSKAVPYLYVISASSGTVVEGKTLTLNGVPMVLYFSDRPNRIAGHMALQEFVTMWSQGLNSFAANPPNATLSVLTSGAPENWVIELTEPQLTGNLLTFTIRVLEGEAPASFKAASLFVDSIVTLSPSTQTGTDGSTLSEAPAQAMGSVYQT